MRKLIIPLAIAAALLFASQNISAQNVGINTTQPDPSAALDIVGTDKGLLIPRVSLQSLTDNATVPNPATALLVYNTNAGLGKVGFYYNSGTPASPSWSLVGGGGSLTLPFSQNGSNISSLFHINNTGGISVGSAISGESESSIGVKGQTVTGRGISGTTNGLGTGVVGYAASNGTGVSATAANTNGKALEVSGPMKIAGPGQSPGSGKVLMSDGSGNATWENISRDVAFRASGTLGNGNEQLLGDDSSIKIAFAAENYDIGNHFNDSNGSPHSSFITPHNGLYHFDAQTIITSSTLNPYGCALSLVLTRGNNKTVIARSKQSGVVSTHANISTDVNLQQGDLLHVEASLFSDLPGTVSQSFEDSFFSGRLLFKQ